MKNIISSLDKIADELQEEGLDKMAEQVDVVSNTIEALFNAKQPVLSPGHQKDVEKMWEKAIKDKMPPSGGQLSPENKKKLEEMQQQSDRLHTIHPGGGIHPHSEQTFKDMHKPSQFDKSLKIP